MKKVLQDILEAAAQAPSGSNSQPWRFGISGDEISVFMTPEKDHPVLNFRNRGTLVANGALLENLIIASEHFGYSAGVQYFPDENDANFIAKILLHEDAKDDDQKLFKAIYDRSTNRKPYELKALPKEFKTQMIAMPDSIGARGITVKFTEDRRSIKILAEAASTNENIFFENEVLHKLFFEEIVWTEKEENEKKSGLYLKTMELKPPQVIALKIFRSWSALKFLNRLGAARGIAKSNAGTYARCGAYGAILCNDSDQDFLHAGRVMERIWLLATSMGLSMHLQTGTNFLYQSLSVNRRIFSEEQAALIHNRYNNIVRVFDAGEKLLPITFRIGYDGAPSAKSSKKAPEIVFVNEHSE